MPIDEFGQPIPYDGQGLDDPLYDGVPVDRFGFKRHAGGKEFDAKVSAFINSIFGLDPQRNIPPVGPDDPESVDVANVAGAATNGKAASRKALGIQAGDVTPNPRQGVEGGYGINADAFESTSGIPDSVVNRQPEVISTAPVTSPIVSGNEIPTPVQAARPNAQDVIANLKSLNPLGQDFMNVPTQADAARIAEGTLDPYAGYANQQGPDMNVPMEANAQQVAGYGPTVSDFSGKQIDPYAGYADPPHIQMRKQMQDLGMTNPADAPISAADILPTTDQIPATPDPDQVLVEAGTPNTPVGTVASNVASEDINIPEPRSVDEEMAGQSPTSAGRLISQFGEGLVRELSKLAPDVSAIIPGGPLLSQVLPGGDVNVGLSDLFKGESGSAEANVPSGAPTAPGVSDNILDNFDDEFYTAPRTGAPPLPPGREDELAAIRGRRGTPVNAPPLPGSASDIATAAFAAPDAPGAFDPETGIATLDPNDTDGIIALANSLADASEAQRAGVLNSLDQETKIAVLARLDEMDQITQAGGDID